MTDERKPVREYARFSRRKETESPIIQVSPRPAKRRSRGVAVAAGLAGLVAVAGIGVWVLAHRPDPNYLRAAERVENYERARPEEARNYANEVYDQALGELSLVPSDSISHDDAVALTRRIRVGRERLERELQGIDQALERRRDERRSRDLTVFARQQASRLNPVTAYPECEDHEH